MEGIDRVDLADDGVCDIERDLAAVFAVDLVAVILCGVMARRDHDAGRAFQRTHCPGEHWGRHELGVDMNTDAVCREHCRRRLCEGIGLDAAVIGDGNGGLFEGAVDIVCKTLRRSANGVDIHSAGAGAEHAAQTAGAEFQIIIEALTDRIRIALDLPEFTHEVGISGCILTPQCVERIFSGHIILHGVHPFS